MACTTAFPLSRAAPMATIPAAMTHQYQTGTSTRFDDALLPPVDLGQRSCRLAAVRPAAGWLVF